MKWAQDSLLAFAIFQDQNSAHKDPFSLFQATFSQFLFLKTIQTIKGVLFKL